MSWVEVGLWWEEGGEIWKACTWDWRHSGYYEIKFFDYMFIKDRRQRIFIYFCGEVTQEN